MGNFTPWSRPELFVTHAKGSVKAEDDTCPAVGRSRARTITIDLCVSFRKLLVLPAEPSVRVVISLSHKEAKNQPGSVRGTSPGGA